MAIDVSDLNRKQSDYKAAVEQWILTIRAEEVLASANHDEAQIDEWEAAGCREEEARNQARSAKKSYEDALRQEYFSF